MRKKSASKKSPETELKTKGNLFNDFNESDILSSLVYLGRLSRVVDFGKVSFKIETITEGESKKLFSQINKNHLIKIKLYSH